MATAVDTAPRRGQRQRVRDRAFFTGAAATMLVATFVGFAPTYYLSHFTAAPALTALVHVHGVVFSAWMLLYVAQTGLIAAGRADLHRRAGILGVALAIVIIVLGPVVAVISAQHGGGGPARNQIMFLVFPLGNILVFAVLVGVGLYRRRRSDIHKRLMLLATLALVVTPLARISLMAGLPFTPPAIGGMVLANLVIVALVIFDVRSRGRLHPATAWAGAFFLASEPLRVVLSQTAIWQDFAHGLIGHA